VGEKESISGCLREKVVIPGPLQKVLRAGETEGGWVS
jgi:hypothetical protein